MAFQLTGLAYQPFAALFELSDAQLAPLNAQRVIATEKPGYPCRVSLRDAEVGEQLLLLPFEHQPANSPYQATGPIFVRRHARQASIAPDEVPPYVSGRLISLRAYDAAHLMRDAVVCEGSTVGDALRQMFAVEETAYIHLHNAKRGCFSCAAVRVS